MAWALRRIDEREVARRGEGGAGRARCASSTPCWTAPSCRAGRGAALLRRGGRRALRRSATSACGRPKLIDATERGAEGALGRAPAGRPLRARAAGRPPARQDQGRAPARGGALHLRHRPASCSASGWRDLIEQLLFEGLLREDPNDGRPLVGARRRRRRCAPSIAASGEVELREAPATEAPSRGRAGPPARSARARLARRRRTTSALFEALRAWRRDEAKAQAVPPYVIFHDRTLAEIARVAPGRPRRPRPRRRRRPGQARPLRRGGAARGARGLSAARPLARRRGRRSGRGGRGASRGRSWSPGPSARVAGRPGLGVGVFGIGVTGVCSGRPGAGVGGAHDQPPRLVVRQVAAARPPARPPRVTACTSVTCERIASSWRGLALRAAQHPEPPGVGLARLEQRLDRGRLGALQLVGAGRRVAHVGGDPVHVGVEARDLGGRRLHLRLHVAVGRGRPGWGWRRRRASRSRPPSSARARSAASPAPGRRR